MPLCLLTNPNNIPPKLTHWLSRDHTNSTLHTNDDLGWKALEVTWLTTQGNRLWVDAFDWLALALLLYLMRVSVKSNNARASTFPPLWSNLGVAIGGLAFVDFVADCARFSSHWQAFSALAGTLSFINTVILLPAWLLWFGKLIPGAKAATFSALADSDSHGGLGAADGAAGSAVGPGRGRARAR